MKLSKIIVILQILFFVLFILTILTKSASFNFMKIDIFSYIFSFKFNPFFIILLLIIILHFFYGRIFCSFICPLGNIISFFDFIFKKFRPIKLKLNKNFTFFPALIIIFILIFYLKVFNITGFFDPISITTRFFVSIFYHNKLLLSFVFIILLSIFGERLWCKYLCPLGFIYRIISYKSKYKRIVQSCSNCSLCSKICPMDAIEKENPLKYDKSLCILCFKCKDYCPAKTTFKFSYNSNFDKSKRDFIKLILISFLMLNFRTFFKRKKILRPPGATNESILKNCIRCLECIKVCPTNVLKPSFNFFEPENFYTPQFRPDLSYCEYECFICTKACPTNAIKRLTLKEKQKWKIGTAKISKEKCVVWSEGINCLVCEEHCPVPEKAIKIVEIFKNNKKVKAPVVDEKLCIGCGICQVKCPVLNSAIRVI